MKIPRKKKTRTAGAGAPVPISSIVPNKHNRDKMNGDDVEKPYFPDAMFKDLGISIKPSLCFTPSIREPSGDGASASTSRVGCFFHSGRLKYNIDHKASTSIQEKLLSNYIKDKVMSYSHKQICSDLNYLITQQKDNENDMLEAFDFIENKTNDEDFLCDDDDEDNLNGVRKNRCPGDDELLWWSSSELQKFCLLRRLLSPIYRISQEEKKLILWKRSLIDILIDIPSIRPVIVNALYDRLDQVKTTMDVVWKEQREKDLALEASLSIRRKSRREEQRDYCDSDSRHHNIKEHNDSEEGECYESPNKKFKTKNDDEIEKNSNNSIKPDPLALLDELQDMIYNILIDERKTANVTQKLDPGFLEMVQKIPKKFQVPSQQQQQQNKGVHMYSRMTRYESMTDTKAYTNQQRINKEAIKVEAKFNRAQKEFQSKINSTSRRSARQQTSNSMQEGESRAKDGSLLFDKEDMTCEEFVKKTRFMEQVNYRFGRDFTDKSRFMLKHINLPDAVLEEIRDLFFEENGAFKKSIIEDVDISIANDPRYISFGKATTTSQREDKRWQVSFRHDNGICAPVKTRHALQKIFYEYKILDEEHEEINDLGILIGGTEDQRIHHDVARQIAVWYEHKSLSASSEIHPPLTGWEVDRLEYNEAMASEYAPASLLLSLNRNRTLFLGVQNNHVELLNNNNNNISGSDVAGTAAGGGGGGGGEKISDDNQWCKITGGCGAKYRIIRKNNNLSVIEVHGGGIFTGDFPHSGVRNFRVDSEEGALIDKFVKIIGKVINDTPSRERIMRSQKTITEMTKFEGLDKICRLHCSTKIKKGIYRQPVNTVGFSYCQLNERDSRCVAQDENLARTRGKSKALIPKKE